METQTLKTKVELLEEILNTNNYLAEASGISQAWVDILKIDSQYVDGREKENLLRLASKFEEIHMNLMKVMEVIRTNSFELIYEKHK
jgi:hypothetical protein